MRVLVLSDKIPSLRLGDGLRAFGLYRHLTARHRFDLLCYARHGETLEADLGEIFASMTTLPFPHTDGARWSLLARAASAFSVSNFKAHCPAMRAQVLRRVQAGDADVVLDFAANMLLCLPPPEQMPVPLVVDSIDEPLLRDVRALTVVPWRQRPRLARQVFMFWRYEKLLGRAAQNIYASEQDAAAYQRFFPGKPAAVVPNGVDVDYFAPLDEPPHEATIVFEGNMMFGANVDAARALVGEVLPALLEQVPSARVQIVGRDPAPEVLALASDRVEVTGTVPVVRPFLARATVFACPMRLGSGIKNKILQAWAMQRPVVATSASLGGLAARDGENVLVRDDPRDMAAAIAAIIVSPALGLQLGRAGRRTVEQDYSWDQSAARFERVLFDVVNVQGRNQRPRATVTNPASREY